VVASSLWGPESFQFMPALLSLPIYTLVGPFCRGLHSFTFQLNLSAVVWDRGCTQGLIKR